MSDARDVRLLRVPHLRAARRTLIDLLADARAATTVVLVPTRHAAVELRRTLARAGAIAHHAEVRLLTRLELYEELHRRLGALTPPLLGPFEREAIVGRASGEAIAAGSRPPFAVRPGLVGEMLDLYDGLRRNGRTVDDFERVLVAALEPGADSDRGAARLLAQTRYLTAVFRSYERALDGLAVLDEHRLRTLVSGGAIEPAIDRVVLTMTDEAAEADSLWPADFDLLTRLEGLAHVDVVATEHVLDAGFRERLFDLLPGIEEERREDSTDGEPVLLVPGDEASLPYHLHRDREEELVAIASRIRDGQDAAHGEVSPCAPACEDILVVYQRPLPYVYLAGRVFGEAGLPFTTADTLPLAAEPYAAALDLVLEAVLSGGAAEPLVRLLESPMFTWRPGGRLLSADDLVALRAWRRAHRSPAPSEDRALRRGGMVVDPGHVAPGAEPIAGAPSSGPRAASPRRAPSETGLRRARAAAERASNEVARLDVERPRSEHLRSLVALLRSRAVRSEPEERHARARAATIGLLEELAAAHGRHDDRPVPFREIVLLVRSAIERHTFAPIAGDRGIRLCDARTARYAEAAEVWVVGVNEGEWPLPSRRSIFYPSGLLRDLGFAREQDRQTFARAAFRDLLGVARACAGVSVVQLEEDSIVRPSVLIEELDDVAMPREIARKVPVPPVGAGALMRSGQDTIPGLRAPAATWLAWRREHFAADDPRVHGAAGPPHARVLGVTQVERYLECPFKFFASVVLGLDEEDDRFEIGLDPRRRGTIVHRVFQVFFERWSAAGHGAITTALLPAARALLAAVTTEELATLPEADRLIEGIRLLGSAAAQGLGERVFRLEASRPEPVVERLLEFDLRGTYDVGVDAPVPITLKGVADRVDLLADGTLRLIDYKTGKAPDARHAIQLAVYALCAEQKLRGYRGRAWRVGEAAYLALADPRPWVPVIRSEADRTAMDAASRRLLEAVQGITDGRFPPSPADRRSCRTCAFAAVCRKDYVGDVA